MKDIIKTASDKLFEEAGVRFYEGMNLESLLRKAVQFGAVKTVKYTVNYLDEKTLKKILFESIDYMKDLDRKEKKKIIKYLTKGGKLVNSRNDIGRTPLFYSVSRRDFDLIRYLIQLGADVNARDINGFTPLHFAVSGDRDIVRYLISKGADVNAKNEYGFTPLHTALITYENWSKYPALDLIENGADVFAKTEDGRTPYDVVRSGYSFANYMVDEYKKSSDRIGRELFKEWFHVLDGVNSMMAYLRQLQ